MQRLYHKFYKLAFHNKLMARKIMEQVEVLSADNFRSYLFTLIGRLHGIVHMPEGSKRDAEFHDVDSRLVTFKKNLDEVMGSLGYDTYADIDNLRLDVERIRYRVECHI